MAKWSNSQQVGNCFLITENNTQWGGHGLVWTHMDPRIHSNRPIWTHEDLYGQIYTIDPSGPLWTHTVPYGSIWIHMGTYGAIWSHMTPYGTIWNHTDPYEPILPHINSYGPTGHAHVWNALIPLNYCHAGMYTHTRACKCTTCKTC